ncbi:hypothetical protein [Solirubrobacter soli]|uniref:hypothetical protein n=1 Tax=Solirubrobacter soli TaxID=363832 RepID=UPI0004899E90|nr:hypothetical protein [Solirubrobacter soli]
MRNGLQALAVSVIALTFLTPSARADDRVPLKAGSVVASSGQGQRVAVAVSNADGARLAVRGTRWHTATLAGLRPNAVRFAQLENGAGLVAWDTTTAVYVRTWDRTGKIGAAHAVLSGVETVWEGDIDHPGWDLSANTSGTVVITAATPTGAVLATVRTPGEEFSAAQQLLASGERMPGLSISPIAADGTAVVSWGPPSEGPDVQPGHATGAAQSNGATFSAIAPPAPPASDPRVWLADGSRTVRVGADVVKLCGTACRNPQLFTWSSGKQVLVFRRNFNKSYTAVRGAGGTFAKPRFASDSAVPVWTAKPGVLQFVTARKGALYLTRR